nr:hypothetical protein [uncultured Porphyromonas sp.]
MGKTDFQASLTMLGNISSGAIFPWLVLVSSSGQKSFIFQAKVRLLLGLKLFGNRAEKEMKLPCKNTALALPSPLSFHRL